MANSIEVKGTVAAGFENVKREFERNFRERGDQGAAVAVFHKGQFVAGGDDSDAVSHNQRGGRGTPTFDQNISTLKK